MNIMPIDSVKFGEVYHKNTKYSILQNYVLKGIEKSFEKTVPNDKYKRSYRDYINAKGYDVLLNPHDKNSIRVNLLKRSVRDEDKKLQLKEGFEYSDEKTRVGVYDKDYTFYIEDVMEALDKDIKRDRKILFSALAVPILMGAMIIGASLGLSKSPASKKVEQKVIEKAMQDSTKIVKDTISLFK